MVPTISPWIDSGPRMPSRVRPTLLLVGALASCTEPQRPPTPQAFSLDWKAPIAVDVRQHSSDDASPAIAFTLHACPQPDGTLEVRDRHFRLLDVAGGPVVHQAFATLTVDGRGAVVRVRGGDSTMRRDALRAGGGAGSEGGLADAAMSARTALQWQQWVGVWARYDVGRALPQSFELVSPGGPFAATIESVEPLDGNVAKVRVRAILEGPAVPATAAELSKLDASPNGAIAIQEVFAVTAVIESPSLRPHEVEVRSRAFIRPEGRAIHSRGETYSFDWAHADASTGICPAPPAVSSPIPFVVAASPDAEIRLTHKKVVARKAEQVLECGNDVAACVRGLSAAGPFTGDIAILAADDLPAIEVIEALEAIRGEGGLARPLLRPASGKFPNICKAARTPLRRGPPRGDDVPVIVSGRRIVVGDAQDTRIDLPEGVATIGAGAAHKPCGAGGYVIEPLRQSLAGQGIGSEGAGGGVILVFEPTVPYRLMAEVIRTAEAAGAGYYHVMVVRTQATGTGN